MIKDDYCNFKTSKLLKEKGFDGECKKYYNLKMLTNPYYGCEYVRNRNLKDENDCIAPTLQMAMKWLREVHKLHIWIAHKLKQNKGLPWYYEIHNIETGTVVKIGDVVCGSYEAACEAAIIYCLKKLI